MGRARRGRAELAGKESLALDREALRYWRLQRGWTQEALSRQRAVVDGETAGISYAQIRRVEKDGRAGPATARLLAALLGVELAQLRPRDVRSLPCGLPRELSVDFVGRSAELETLLALLQREGEARIAISIEGLPGVGKTELALQACAHCERSGAFRIFWLSARSPDLTSIWADEVARNLGVEHPDPKERARLVLRIIDSLAEPTLIVLDDVQHWSASQPWPRPQGRHIRWLVTTRTKGLGDRAFEHMELALLDEASAVALMARIAGEQITRRPGFADLMRQLGGYTLAVELAAAFLARFPEVEPEEYGKALREGKGELFEAEVAAVTAYHETLDGSLELLWRRLPPSTRAALELAACFAQEPTSMALSDAASLGRRLRAELRDFHLIRGERSSWSMHALVRAFALRRAEPLALARARVALLRAAQPYWSAAEAILCWIRTCVTGRTSIWCYAWRAHFRSSMSGRWLSSD
jgi:transcriptional regulator with XRE-family HTH domain